MATSEKSCSLEYAVYRMQSSSASASLALSLCEWAVEAQKGAWAGLRVSDEGHKCPNTSQVGDAAVLTCKGGRETINMPIEHEILALPRLCAGCWLAKFQNVNP